MRSRLAHAEREDVDEDVAVVAAVERRLAADGRDADAVAVAADPAHDAVDEVLHARRIELAEPQRVEPGDRPRAHGEDVAKDAAHACRRALIRLDEGRMVVRLHLERRDPAVADVDDPGVLAGTLRRRAARRRELAQVDPRRFVGAVLRPHDREDAQLRVIGRAARICSMRWYSSGVRPWEAMISGVMCIPADYVKKRHAENAETRRARRTAFLSASPRPPREEEASRASPARDGACASPSVRAPSRDAASRTLPSDRA